MSILSRLVAGFTSFTQPAVAEVENSAIANAVANFGYTRVPADRYGIPMYMPVYLPPAHAAALNNIATRSRLAPVNGGGFNGQ